MASGSRPPSIPSTTMVLGTSAKSSCRVVVRAVIPSGLWAPSRTSSGSRAHDLEAAWDLQPGQGLLHHLAVEGPVEEGLRGGDGHGQVVALVSAVDGEVQLVQPSAGGAHVQDPAPDGDPAVLRGEVPVPAPGALRALGLEDRLQVPVGLAEHQGRAGLDDPRLLARDGGSPTVPPVGVVPPHVGDHGYEAVGHVRGVVATEETDLDHGDVHGLLGEPGERGRGDQLEPGRLALDEGLDRGQLVEHARQVLVRDRSAVPPDSLVQGFEMRAGVEADGQAMAPQDRLQHPGRGALPVRPGEVDDGVGGLRVTQDPDQGPHPVQRQVVDDPRGDRAGLEVQVAVQPPPCCREIHHLRVPSLRSGTPAPPIRCGAPGCSGWHLRRHPARRRATSANSSATSAACSTTGRATSTAYSTFGRVVS